MTIIKVIYLLESLPEFEVNEEETTVEDLRKIISEKLKFESSDSVRMVLNGKVLTGQEELKNLDKNLNWTIYVQKKEKINSPVVSPPIKEEQTDLLSKLADNPLVTSLMSNPEVMHAMLMSNPRVKEMVSKNPEWGHLFKDKKFLEEMAQTARNPARMKELMRNSDTALARLDTMPGGFEAVRKLYSTLQEPLQDAFEAQKDLEEEERKSKELKKLLGVDKKGEDGKKSVNNAPLPNPWATNQTLPQQQNDPFLFPSLDQTFNNSHFGNSQGSFNPFLTQSGLGGLNNFPFMQMLSNPDLSNSGPNFTALQSNNQANNTSAGSLEQYKAKYRDQLSKLKDMGFDNEDLNIKALLASGGNLDSAVNYLLKEL